MKKYQLKLDNQTLIESDTINRIMRYIKYHLDICEIKGCVVWMNGQVLD